ncbi:MAG: hypothetical protein D6805_04585 [Planctomycetota bacterium]|nr:MAG: hypothetical protein D6805_04585 [Planctomycetota bacterium]
MEDKTVGKWTTPYLGILIGIFLASGCAYHQIKPQNSISKQEFINMVRTGLPEKRIAQILQKHKATFHFSVDEILQLRRWGASNRLILLAMGRRQTLEEKKKKSKRPIQKTKPTKPKGPKPISKKELMDLAKKKADENYLKQRLLANPKPLDLSAEEMVQLRKLGYSDDLVQIAFGIKVLAKPSKTKAKKTPKNTPLKNASSSNSPPPSSQKLSNSGTQKMEENKKKYPSLFYYGEDE